PAPGDDTAMEVSQSLRYLPLPYQPGGRTRSELSHDQYWRLPTGERAAREAALLQMPVRARVDIGGAGLYEAQQAPLYYVLMVPVYRAFSNAKLAGRLLAIRFASVLIASLAIPLIYATTKELFGSHRIALLLTCVAASLPGLLMDVSRAGNESLAVVLGTAMTLILISAIRRGGSLKHWLALGIALGLGLLTKAYFLAFLPLIPALALMLMWRRGAWKRQAVGATLSLLVAIVISAAWYARMERLTGSLSGEKNAAAIANASFAQKFTAATHINWLRIVYDQIYSQLWLGGWSFLRVRPWMYTVFELLAALCVAGLVRYTVRRVKHPHITRMSVTLAMLLLMLILFEPGLFYQALAVFMIDNEAFGPGWYFYVLLAPELLLLTAGAWALFGRRGGGWLAATATFFALALNLYTMHLLLLPYYTGLIAHSADGSFHAAHIGILASEFQLSNIARTPFVRTQVISPAIFAVCWVSYVLGAVCPAAIAFANSYFFGKPRHK
ncbi:MAG: glycosyltransferase family 39 protein, partial [Bryobacteraceae bacterium]